METLAVQTLARVLGKKAGNLRYCLWHFKSCCGSWHCFYFDREASIWAGLAAAFGHCYPIFAGFRGGKAVATMFGFLLSTSIFTFQNAWYVIVPLIFFLIVLYLGKMVSLASMIAAFTSSLYITYMQMNTSIEVVLASWLLTVLVTLSSSFQY